MVAKSDGNNEASLLYPMVCSLICMHRYVNKDCIAWICDTYVITNIINKVKWSTQHSVDTSQWVDMPQCGCNAGLTELDRTNEPTCRFNELWFVKPEGVRPGNVIRYIQNLLYHGSNIYIIYI